MHMCFTVRVCVLLNMIRRARGRIGGFYTPTYSKQQSASLHKTFESSSGFDENFPTSEYPHLPALRCELFFSSLSFLETVFYSWASAVIPKYASSYVFKWYRHRNLLLKFQVKSETVLENIMLGRSRGQGKNSVLLIIDVKSIIIVQPNIAYKSQRDFKNQRSPRS